MQYRLTIYICRSQAALEGGAELLAIYKKDIRAYFSSIYGYVITMSFYAAAGIVFVSQNILHESSDLKPLFDTLAKFMILLVPLITKNAVAFERKNGTDRMLLTSPVSIFRIVLSKYLACMTILFICIACSAIFMAITAVCGKLAFGKAMVSFLGFMMLGSAMVSVGILISSMMSEEKTAGVVIFVVMSFLLIISMVTKSIPVGLSESVLFILSPYSFMEYYEAGILSFASILYYLCLSFIALRFAGRSIERRRRR